MKKPFLMPMKLQFFAEETADDQTTTETTETEETAAEETTEKELDSEKVVEKLQKRLASKTAAEKETKTQLDQALARIKELENAGKKGVKTLSDEEKAIKAQEEKDAEIAKLKSQIKIAESTQQADEVLKEAGLAVGKDILALVVAEDDTQTLANVKALITYTQDQQAKWEVRRNTGTTPKRTINNQNTVTQEQFDAMPYAQKSALASSNPELFKKLTGGY
ncbi:MAG: scaffolding protein [Enterococcus canintestini]|uniref:scaffolding protein n=1 Tax=Enterococcus canintestini TaxID=317010 RepID=UPI003991678F